MIYEIYIEFIKQNYHLYIIMVILLLGLPLQKITIPHYYGAIISSLKDKKLGESKKLFGMLLIVYIIVGLLGLCSSYINKLIWPRMEAFVRKKVFDKIIKSYNESYEELKTGEITTKLHEFPWVLDVLYNKIQKFLFNNSIIIISSFIYLSRYHYSLGLVYILSIICIVGLSYSYVENCKENTIKGINSYSNYFEEIDDTLSNLISIFCNKKVDKEIDRISEKNTNIEENQILRNECDVKYKLMYSALTIAIFIILNYTSYSLYLNKKIDITVLSAIFIINFSLLDDLLVLYYDTREMVSMSGHIEVFNKFINKLPKSTKSDNVQSLNLQNEIDIKLINVNFKHKNNNKYIYKNLNLHIPPNQDILIMGKIGSGKSTFAKLIINLQSINEGTILINNQNIQKIKTDDIRSNIIYVPQHPQLFNRTLFENLTYGLNNTEKINEQDIYDLLDNIGMKDIQKIFKNKMHKKVGKNGSELSGGQRQIVWLLRVIFKKSPVIIMDEPTSSLDEESKVNVFKLINLIKKTKTVIIISHDKLFESILDRLIVFDNGSIVSDNMLRN